MRTDIQEPRLLRALILVRTAEGHQMEMPPIAVDRRYFNNNTCAPLPQPDPVDCSRDKHEEEMPVSKVGDVPPDSLPSSIVLNNGCP